MGGKQGREEPTVYTKIMYLWVLFSDKIAATTTKKESAAERMEIGRRRCKLKVELEVLRKRGGARVFHA